jgi:hypothetical protein
LFSHVSDQRPDNGSLKEEILWAAALLAAAAAAWALRPEM